VTDDEEQAGKTSASFMCETGTGAAVVEQAYYIAWIDTFGTLGGEWPAIRALRSGPEARFRFLTPEGDDHCVHDGRRAELPGLGPAPPEVHLVGLRARGGGEGRECLCPAAQERSE
jgi:hypothetical protein